MFCIKCGKEIAEDAKFCIYCGADVSYETNYTESADDENRSEKSNNNFTNKNERKDESKEKISMKAIIIAVLSIIIIILLIVIFSIKNDEKVNRSDLSQSDTSYSVEDVHSDVSRVFSDQGEAYVTPSENWTVASNYEELKTIVERFPGDDWYNIDPLLKYTWSSANVLTLAYDATPMFQKFFGIFDVYDYAKNKNAIYATNQELYDAAGSCFASGYYVKAEDIEKRLENAADTVFGIDKSILRESSFYNSEFDAYIYQTNVHENDDSTYIIEKVILYENYAFAYRRLWSSYNPDTKKYGSFEPRSRGCVSVLCRDEGDTYYHYISNFAVKDIDKVLYNTFDNKFYVEQPDHFEEKYISFVTSGSGLRIRTGPGENYDSIITIPLDSPVLCLAEENGWTYVKFNTVYGWMSNEYLRKQ